jgi:DNA primase
VDAITLVLDGDTAGQRRTNDLLELFISERVNVRILTLPDDLDPCDYLAARGLAAFQELASAAPDALQHKIRSVTQQLDPARDPHGANQALEEILRTIALAPAGDSPGAMRLREHQLLPALAREFLVAEQELRLRLDSLRRQRTYQSPTAAVASPAARELNARDLELLEILSVEPALVGQAAAEVPLEAVTPGPARTIFQVYLQIWQAAGTVEFQQVLCDIEDLELKSLLVEIDERAQNKARRSEQSPAQRLAELIALFQRLADERTRRQQLAALDQPLGDTEELSVLQDLLELARRTRAE